MSRRPAQSTNTAKRPRRRGAFALLCLGLCLTATAATAQLAGSEWRPVQIGTLDLREDAGLFVLFESEGQFAGHAGCNRFFGSYRIDGSAIEIGPLGATRMACPEDVMDRERRFLDALGAAVRFQRDKTELTLFDDADEPVARFVQTDWD